MEHIPAHIQVVPCDGTKLPIPPISSREEAERLVIRHKNWIFQEGKDCVTTLTMSQETVRVSINFQGNYSGNVLRSFVEQSGGGSDGGGGYQTVSISAQATPGGSITPDGKTPVRWGENLLFTMQAEPAYRLDSVLVDGQPDCLVRRTR